VSACDRGVIRVVASSVSFAHHTDGAETTPGRTRSVITASAVNVPRSLKIETRARLDAARVGVVGVNLQRRLAGGAAQRGDVDERGVEERMRGRRDQRERVAAHELGIALFRFVWRDVFTGMRSSARRGGACGVDLDPCRSASEARAAR
jgi:hypothetical protein